MRKLTSGFGALTASAALVLGGCAPSETYPEHGIVTDKTIVEVDGDCLMSLDNICMVYDQVDEHRVVINACLRNRQGDIVLADTEYLQKHQAHPSDYPLSDLDISVDQQTGAVTHCSTTFVVDEERYAQVALGSIFTDPER